MNKSKLDAYANVSISPKEAIDGCIHKLQINDESPINLVIPPRIKHEQIMRLAGKGNFQPQTGRRGDLYLTILIEGEARTSKINVDGYSSGTRISKNKKGLITAGIGIVLVGALGVVAQYAEQTKNKSITPDLDVIDTIKEITPVTEPTITTSRQVSTAQDFGRYGDPRNAETCLAARRYNALVSLQRDAKRTGFIVESFMNHKYLTERGTTLTQAENHYRAWKDYIESNCPDAW